MLPQCGERQLKSLGLIDVASHASVVRAEHSIRQSARALLPEGFKPADQRCEMRRVREGYPQGLDFGEQAGSGSNAPSASKGDVGRLAPLPENGFPTPKTRVRVAVTDLSLESAPTLAEPVAEGAHSHRL